MTDIANKIRKILAKADSTTSPEEASVFMEKAHSMLEAHGLSLLDLGRLDNDDPIGTDHGATKNFAAENWLKMVSSQLARYYGADLVATSIGNKTKHSVIGRESARITYQLMQPYVARQVRQLARQAVKDGEFKSESRAKTAIGNSLSLRIHRLVDEQEDRRKEDLPGKGLNALVPVDMIRMEMETQFPNLREARRGRAVSTTEASRRAASKVSLHRQTGGGLVKRIEG